MVLRFRLTSESAVAPSHAQSKSTRRRVPLLATFLLAILVGLCQAQIGPGGEPELANPGDYTEFTGGDADVPQVAAPPQLRTIGLDHRHQFDANWNLATGSQFGDFRAAISAQGYGYASRDAFEAANLSGLSALVLYQPYTGNTDAEFSASEITAIHNFVENGGGLFVVAEGGGGATITSLNQVVAPYGIVYNDSAYDADGRTFSKFWYHPVTQGIAKARVDYQRGMSIAAPSLDMTPTVSMILIANVAVAANGDDFFALREGRDGAGNCAFITDSNMFSENSTDDAHIGSEDNLDLLKAIFDFIVKQKPYTCGAAPAASYYRSVFESSNECWASGSATPAFVAPVLSRTNGALCISPGGSAAAFGFWTSPALNVSPYWTYRVSWKVRSTTTADKCPQFRLRINDLGGRDSLFRAVESRGGAENSPGTSEVTYTTTYNTPPGVAQITLSLDILSFDAVDNLNATIELGEVTVVP